MKNEFTAMQKVEDLQVRMEQAVCLMDAVHDAVAYGHTAPECYAGAIAGVRNYLSDLAGQMEGVVKSTLSSGGARC